MEESSVTVSLSLGSNLGDKVQNLNLALIQIENSLGQLISVSDFYISEPWGFSSENIFLNCCCLLQSNLTVFDFISTVKEIERDLGRDYKFKIGYEDRIIDIDVIFFGDLILSSENVTIPHKNFRKRDFVLLPLSQLTNIIDPETFISVRQFTK